MLAIKILFRKSNGLVLGAQIVGEEGVARRIDVIAMAIQMGCTIYDLEEAELSYAPHYGSAKDPVNFAGEGADTEAESIPEALNIPFSRLRSRLNELPIQREINSYSPVCPASILRNTNPVTERVQSPEYLRRDAFTFASGKLKELTYEN